jgi:hypothetical protein
MQTSHTLLNTRYHTMYGALRLTHRFGAQHPPPLLLIAVSLVQYPYFDSDEWASHFNPAAIWRVYNLREHCSRRAARRNPYA